jgi:hypothetical protein
MFDLRATPSSRFVEEVHGRSAEVALYELA